METSRRQKNQSKDVAFTNPAEVKLTQSKIESRIFRLIESGRRQAFETLVNAYFEISGRFVLPVDI